MYYTIAPICGAFFFSSSYILTKRLLYKCPDLNQGQVCSISTRVVSAWQALLSCYVGLLTMKNIHEDIINDTYWLPQSWACFCFPYFYYDMYAMYESFWYTDKLIKSLNRFQGIKRFIYKNKIMTLHHLVCPVVYLPFILWFRNGKGDFFIGCLYLFEVPVIFISFRAILQKLNMRQTKLYLFVSILTIVNFAIFRVGIFFYIYNRYSKQVGITVFETIRKIPMKCNLGCFGLAFLQIYWLLVMMRIGKDFLKKRRFEEHKDK